MKATINIPDDLYRQVKARSALRGRTVREVAIELFQRWVEDSAAEKRSQTPEEWLRSWLHLADEYGKGAKPGPSAREILVRDRNRLEAKR